MPLYEFECRACHASETLILSVTDYTSWAARNHFTCTCTGTPTRMSRNYSFTSVPPFDAHFSDTTGQYVSSKREFRDQLKSLSEDATRRTGIDHDLVPVDLRDMASDAPEIGMDSTHDRAVLAGTKPPSSSPLR